MATMAISKGGGIPQTTTSTGAPAANVVVANGGNFTPSSTGSAVLTMNGTAQSGALSTGVTKLCVYNKGATTEDIYLAFGATALEAEGNLTHSTDHATTGHLIPNKADMPNAAYQIVNVPSAAYGGYYAVENDTAGDIQVVVISQGV